MTQAFTVNKSAWHYRWLCFYNASKGKNFRGGDPIQWFEDNELRPGDFCQYWRMVLLWPSLRIGIHLVMYAIATVLVANSTGTGALTISYWGIGIALFIAACFAINGVYWLISKTAEKAVDFVGERSIVKTAYAAYKGKFCPVLDYQNSEGDSK